jgi:allophanate hydrolase subunit 1
MVYKVGVIITTQPPSDLQDTIHNLVISSCKGISYLLVSLPSHQSTHQITSQVLEKLSSELQFSEKLETYSMRRNVVHVTIPGQWGE